MIEPKRPNQVWFSAQLAFILILSWTDVFVTGHFVYYAFPASCRTHGPTGCGGGPLIATIVTALVGYVLAIAAISIATYFVADIKHRTRHHYVLAGIVAILTAACTAFQYPQLVAESGAHWPWNAALLADLVLAAAGATSMAAVWAYESSKGRRFRPTRGLRGLRRPPHE